jgi:hypothetical protein
VLDEEDLALIGEANPEWERKTATQASSFRKSCIVYSDIRSSPSSSASNVAIERKMIETESGG